MSCIIDVDVISGHHYLRGGGGGTITLHQRVHHSHGGHVLAIAPLSAYNIVN